MDLKHKDFTGAQLFVICTAFSYSVIGKMSNLISSIIGQIAIWQFMRKDATTQVFLGFSLARLFLISGIIIYNPSISHFHTGTTGIPSSVPSSS